MTCKDIFLLFFIGDRGNIHFIIEKSYFSNSEFLLNLPGNLFLYELEDYVSF